MDKIEDWMNRTLGETVPPAQKRLPENNSNKEHPEKKRRFAARDLRPRGGRPPYKKQAAHPEKPAPKPKTPILRGKLKVIPLGGLDEVGKNMMVFEYEEDIVIVDMGFEFPSEDLLGIDYVVPDVSYLEANKHRIRGIVITHGHLDHIGGIPYILPKIGFPPIYATKLTIGLIQKRIEEFNQEKMAKLHSIHPDDTLRLGKMTCQFFRVTHSIPDAVAVVVGTPVGKCVVTGDYKFDETPASEFQKAEVHKMEKLGKEGVLALFGDSTNALKPGHSMSEEQVKKTMDQIFSEINGRMIIATFSSQIGRIQQFFELAAKHGRKVYISGRSMRDNVDIATRLGYLKAEKGLVSDIKRYSKDIPDNKALIITTGSQGEAVSALSRIAGDDHANIKLKKGDTIILSSSPIIGNERAIATVVNKLCMQGAHVIHNQLRDIHSSGHGYQDEIKRMTTLLHPRYLVPVHGEYYMRQAHAEFATSGIGMPADRVLMIQNGDTLVADQQGMRIGQEKVETKYILIDGSGEGKMGSQVQFDREIMSQNGILIVLIPISKKGGRLAGTPDVITRGFIYMHETEEITSEIIKRAAEAYKRIRDKNPGASRQDVKKYVRQTLDKFTHNTLSRRPLIVPLLIER